MYEPFFGLRERPFDLVPNPRFLFLPPRQREAFSNLRYALAGARGLTLLIGEAGTGKTTLVHAALGEIDAAHVECVLLSNPTLTRAEFYEFLSEGFNLGANPGRSKTRFLADLRRHLIDRHEAGQLSALVLDEAQSLPYELLEEVRLLSNMELETVKLLNVVLAGQPELAARLNEVGLRQLKQRIALRCELGPYDFQETAAYIAGRLRLAGGEPAAIFTREAILAVHAAAAGLPRTVNVICENALINGFGAGVRPVTKALVDEVCRDFDLTSPPATFAAPAADAAEEPASSGTAPELPRPAEPQPQAPAAAPELEPALFSASTRRRRFSFF